MSVASVSPETVERLLAEGAEPVGRIADKLQPERGKRVRSETLAKWIRFGKRGVRLEGFQAGGKGWQTSLKAVARFFARISGLASQGATDLQRLQRSAKAAEEAKRIMRKK